MLTVIGLVCLCGSVVLGVVTKPNGATDVSLYFFVADPNGDPNTAPNVEDYDLYYVEEGRAISAKADVTALAAADSAHADNKAYHVGQGIVRVDSRMSRLTAAWARPWNAPSWI
jgi:hypothetical protein